LKSSIEEVNIYLNSIESVFHKHFSACTKIDIDRNIDMNIDKNLNINRVLRKDARSATGKPNFFKFSTKITILLVGAFILLIFTGKLY